MKNGIPGVLQIRFCILRGHTLFTIFGLPNNLCIGIICTLIDAFPSKYPLLHAQTNHPSLPTSAGRQHATGQPSRLPTCRRLAAFVNLATFGRLAACPPCQPNRSWPADTDQLACRRPASRSRSATSDRQASSSWPATSFPVFCANREKRCTRLGKKASRKNPPIPYNGTVECRIRH